MAAKNHRFRAVSRRLLAGALGMCALIAMAFLAGNPTRCGAQSQTDRQPPPAQQQPAPPVANDSKSAPTQPANPNASQPATEPAPGSQPGNTNTQKKADQDDDWPAPEWETPENQTSSASQAQAPTVPASGQVPGSQSPAAAQATPASTQKSALAVSASGAQSAPAQPAAQAPAKPRPDYTRMTPEERRKQEVADECAYLLKLATDLKTQVDKASKDELSVSVVRKAAELEQVAHKVRNGTALSAGKEPGPEPKEDKAQ